jgi:O-antigen/teichoic acid export membrane protein
MLVRGGLPFAMIQLSLSFAFQSDNIFLSQYGYSDQQVGWYSAAYSLMLTASVLVGTFNRAILPSLAREHETNPESITPWYYRSVKALAFVGMPMAVGGMLLADKLINFLYPDYPPAAVAFAILIWYIPMHLYTAFSGNLTTSIKKESSAARIFLGEGLVNVALNFILIPPFGVIGASFATLLTEVFGSSLFYVLFRRTFGPGLNFKKMVRLAFSAILMGVVVFLLRDLDLFVVIAVGVAVYLVLVWLTRAFSQSEIDGLVKFFLRLRLRPASPSSP